MHVDQTMNPASLDPSASAIAFLLIIQALQNLTTQMVPWSTRGRSCAILYVVVVVVVVVSSR